MTRLKCPYCGFALVVNQGDPIQQGKLHMFKHITAKHPEQEQPDIIFPSEQAKIIKRVEKTVLEAKQVTKENKTKTREIDELRKKIKQLEKIK